MKTTILLLFVLASTLASETGVREIDTLTNRWKEKREQAVAPIDAAYLRDLNKLKNKYTRLGDLDKALACEKKIKALGSKPIILCGGSIIAEVKDGGILFSLPNSEREEFYKIEDLGQDIVGKLGDRYAAKGGDRTFGKPWKGRLGLFSDKFRVHICEKGAVVFDREKQRFDSVMF